MSNNVRETFSAGGVVLNSRGEVLVVSQYGTSWSLPKGHLDPGEDNLEAAKREIYEESGVKDLTLIKELGSYKRHRMGVQVEDDTSELKNIFMFLFKTTQEELNPIDPENPDAKWIKKEDVANLLTHKKDKEFFLSIIDKMD